MRDTQLGIGNVYGDLGVRKRPANGADWAQIVALDREIFAVYGAEEAPEIIGARLAVFAAGCVVLTVAEGEGVERVVGYLTTEKWAAVREPRLDEDPYTTHTPSGKVLNITTLAVDPAYQSRGLGRQLLDAAIDIAQREGCSEIILETARAEPFYRRHGFEKIGERRQRGIVLYIMRRVLVDVW